MKYIIDEETHWQNDTAILYPRDVAEQLRDCGAFEVAADEKIGAARLDDNGWLMIEVLGLEDAVLKREVCLGMSDIRECFNAADYYQWAKDEDGDDVLLCFGCC